MALTKLTSNLIEGGTGTDWVTAIQTSNFTAAAGKGYFVNTTSQVLYVNLPVGVVGMEITIQDYAGTFGTNKVILNANGSEKIQGSALEGRINTNNATAVLIYQDATKGWTSQDVQLNATTISWAIPTGQSLTYSTPSPQSSQGAAGTTFPTTTFTVTKAGEVISGTATIAGLPSGITATQIITGSGAGNILTVTLTGTFSSTDYTNTALTLSGLTVAVPPLLFDYMIIGGGGSGGESSGRGGGGAGGLATGTSQTLSTSVSVTIGAGGANGPNGNNGSISSLSGNVSATANGGGQGGASQAGGAAGSPGFPGGSGGTYDGIQWYLDGGGGGLGAAGQNYAANSNTPHVGANGGIGTGAYSTWAAATSTGDNGYYGGGGGAYGWHRSSPNNYTDWDINTGVGGTGGGGNSFPTAITPTSALSGTANTGGGSGNCGGSSNSFRTGGSGICIIRYSGSQAATGGTIVTTGGYTYHTFTASGTLTKT